MSDFKSNGALGALDSQLGDTAASIKALEAPANETADAIDQAFAKAGQSLARSLAKAASDGKISLKELASALISAVDAAAGTSSGGSGGLGGGLGAVLSQIFGAAGGFVGAGGAYLVGERGPEVFRPSASGVIESTGAAPPVNITVMVGGDAQTLVRSEAQVAGALNRAARLGLR